MTTTGAQRKPGVQARLAEESPKDSRRSHLNPGFRSFGTHRHGGGRIFLRRHAPARPAGRWQRECADGRCMSADAEAADAKALRRSIREQRRATPASQRISAEIDRATWRERGTKAV